MGVYRVAGYLDEEGRLRGQTMEITPPPEDDPDGDQFRIKTFPYLDDQGRLMMLSRSPDITIRYYPYLASGRLRWRTPEAFAPPTSCVTARMPQFLRVTAPCNVVLQTPPGTGRAVRSVRRSSSGLISNLQRVSIYELQSSGFSSGTRCWYGTKNPNTGNLSRLFWFSLGKADTIDVSFRIDSIRNFSGGCSGSAGTFFLGTTQRQSGEIPFELPITLRSGLPGETGTVTIARVSSSSPTAAIGTLSFFRGTNLTGPCAENNEIVPGC